VDFAKSESTAHSSLHRQVYDKNPGTSPELKIGTVCEPCNNGWMSSLEERNIPLIGCLLQDISTPLDACQQSSLAVWTLKTAMVLDSVNKRDRSLFMREPNAKTCA
jgi:hypothetical protein